MSDDEIVYISLPSGTATTISPRATGAAESHLYARAANDEYRRTRPFGYAPQRKPKRTTKARKRRR